MADTNHIPQPSSDPARVTLHAIKTLSSIEPSNIEISEDDIDVLERIHSAGCKLVAFLDQLNTVPTVDPAEIAFTIATLLSIPFLNRLFEFRRLFHSIADRFEYPDATTADVCWVDHLFSRLGNTGPAVLRMTGAVEEVPNDELLTISKHRNEAALHGAAQLPHSLSDLVGVVHSDYASPAAVRLTLRLLYAVYITGPHLGNVDVWTSDGPEPVVLLQALHAYIHKIHASSNDETKVADAMAVALFAAVDSARGRTESSPFRPHTQATLLKMISATLPSPWETFTVLTPVTRPQVWLAALFAAGHTVQWCWTAWSDERIVGYDTILSLTTTWLYHLSQEDHCVFPTTCHWHSTFSMAISVNPSAAAVAISGLLRRMKQSLTSSQHATPNEILDVVMKCCQGASWLLAASKDGQSSTDLSRRFSESLCGLFFLLPDGCLALDIKDIIIEGMSYASHDVFADSLAELSGEGGFNVASRLDDSIHAICRLDQDAHWPVGRCRSTMQLLQFIALIIQAKIPVKRWFYRKSISALFKHIIDWLAYPLKGSTDEREKVLQSLLTTLAVLEISGDWGHITKLWAHEDIWYLVMDREHWGALIDAAFATYVIATANQEGRDVNSVRHSTAWAFLCDRLRETLSDRSDKQDPSTKIYVCAVTVAAMNCVVDHANTSTLNYVRSSPWTMSLYQDLHHLEREQRIDDGLEMIRPLTANLLSKLSQILREVDTGDELKEPDAERRISETRLLCFATEQTTGPYLCLANVNI